MAIVIMNIFCISDLVFLFRYQLLLHLLAIADPLLVGKFEMLIHCFGLLINIYEILVPRFHYFIKLEIKLINFINYWN